MAYAYFNKYDREGLPKKGDKPLHKIIAVPSDLLNLNDSIEMISDDKLRKYALEHPEQNMVELFTKFKYPVPQNKEEFEDPRFNASFLFKKDGQGNIIPRENIYWCEKNVKNYQNPLNSSYYSLLDNSISYERGQKRLSSIDKCFKKIQKRRVLDRSKSKNNRARKSFKGSQSKPNSKERQKLIYNACMRYYSSELDNKLTSEVKLEDIIDLGQVYYLIKTGSNTREETSIFEVDNEDFLSTNISDEEKKKIFEVKYINSLLKNSKVAKDKFGPFSWVKGDSQIIGEAIGKIKLETQNRLEIRSSNILFDKYTIFLLLKAKRIKYDDVMTGNQFYFKFYWRRRRRSAVKKFCARK